MAAGSFWPISSCFLPAAVIDPTLEFGWGWLIGWGILAGGLIAVLRVMVKRDKIVLKLGSIEENPDGTMTVVCAGYQNKKPLPLDLSTSVSAKVRP